MEQIQEQSNTGTNVVVRTIIIPKKIRSNFELTDEIAIALRDIILKGGKLPLKHPQFVLIRLSNGEEKKIKASTVVSWVTRNNVIPKIGLTLREYLDKARIDRKEVERIAMEKRMLEKIEMKHNRIMSIRTNEPIYIKGRPLTREDGTIIRKENPKLLATVAEHTRFLSERLIPKKYAKMDKTVNEHIFTLSNLRKFDQQMQEAEESLNQEK